MHAQALKESHHPLTYTTWYVRRGESGFARALQVICVVPGGHKPRMYIQCVYLLVYVYTFTIYIYVHHVNTVQWRWNF